MADPLGPHQFGFRAGFQVDLPGHSTLNPLTVPDGRTNGEGNTNAAPPATAPTASTGLQAQEGREVIITPETANLLQAWLTERNKLLTTPNPTTTTPTHPPNTTTTSNPLTPTFGRNVNHRENGSSSTTNNPPMTTNANAPAQADAPTPTPSHHTQSFSQHLSQTTSPQQYSQTEVQQIIAQLLPKYGAAPRTTPTETNRRPHPYDTHTHQGTPASYMVPNLNSLNTPPTPLHSLINSSSSNYPQATGGPPGQERIPRATP
eukprot:GHVU01010804.1.p1 GENE.GHVU01010804.1~~GHVU01010804.1.p1  ORF type:complete len:268 (+),score=20.92 GHVU01010804.1:23-805(+)